MRSDIRAETEPKRAESTAIMLFSAPSPLPFSMPSYIRSTYNGDCFSNLSSIMFFTIQDGISPIPSRRAFLTRKLFTKLFTKV